ncbi:similar to Saccharomyces cerevisiae YGR049W SCM4 Potential regulatory effector of CDC4 function [Maudiozyma saulgeensis]|uniref:Similar to Saccharomyces cerevisiae YGR049W SCM4 Potential regulatory effector of CDC4 function n=1 Tax=Maudiozyma saulgeensis TaxID=1789683 RepID=A0A1X7QZ10_9SACH|nr:similar to Saccharomyces cerevisiae YGR049W SCM4 Potential regulatory effector of CDC4 function [Kazachstania saulgeensis]
MGNQLADTSKAIAISSLGLYAGLLTSTTAITSIAPLNVIKRNLTHVWYMYGVAGGALATTSTAAFGLCYYISSGNARDYLSLIGALIGPLTGSMVYISSLLKFDYKPKSSIPNLPPNHPSVISDDGEIKTCPFGNGEESKDKSRPSPGDSCGSGLLTPININLAIVSTISVASFVKIVFSNVSTH